MGLSRFVIEELTRYEGDALYRILDDAWPMLVSTEDLVRQRSPLTESRITSSVASGVRRVFRTVFDMNG